MRFTPILSDKDSQNCIWVSENTLLLGFSVNRANTSPDTLYSSASSSTSSTVSEEIFYSTSSMKSCPTITS